MIMLYTGTGNITDGTVKDALGWISCGFKRFL